MTTPSVVPCTAWTPVGCTDIDPSAGSISGTMLAAAQEILYQKTGRQFDQCTLTLRPCKQSCYGTNWPWSNTWNQWGTGWPYPYLYAGQWFNLGCGDCPSGGCSCTTIHDILLPQPVASIEQIMVDGIEVPATIEHVILYDHRRLVRTDGEAWPTCNDLSKPDTAEDTWSITVVTGTPVPPLGQLALGELTRELINACMGADCRLPSNVQSIVRQGISQTRLDPNEVWADGKLGLFFSDLFISTYNPDGLPDRARAFDPDRRGPSQPTWP